MIQKIVIIGPESTGKSTLCLKLAAHYNTVSVPEFARKYLEKKKEDYKFEDLWNIAEGQLHAEDRITGELEQAVPPGNDVFSEMDNSRLFIDTDLAVIKVWSEFVFNKCDNRILTQIAKRSYQMYLLCAPDLPWVEDGLREYPDVRTREVIYQYYKDFVINQSTPWVEITGGYNERLQKAIAAIDNL